jgi:hypothetical protein
MWVSPGITKCPSCPGVPVTTQECVGLFQQHQLDHVLHLPVPSVCSCGSRAQQQQGSHLLCTPMQLFATC